MAPTNTIHQCTVSDYFTTPDELLVSQILGELPLLVQRSEFSLGLLPAWPVRRKRTALVSPPDSVSVIPPPPPPPPPSSENDKESSPTTPFSLDSLPLSRSDSDENTDAKLPIKKASLDEKSQYLETIDQLGEQNEGLVGSNGVSKLIPSSGESTSSIKAESPSSSSALENQFYQCQPPIKNQTAVPTAEQSNGHNFQISKGAIPLYDHSFGPTGIPDLNLSPEENDQKNYMILHSANGDS